MTLRFSTFISEQVVEAGKKEQGAEARKKNKNIRIGI